MGDSRIKHGGFIMKNDVLTMNNAGVITGFHRD